MNKLENYESIYDYITAQETAYKKPIPVNEVWQWGMYEHVLTSDLYINSQLRNGKTDFTPVKNITRPILNLQHRAEDVEMKDIQIYANGENKEHLSFLVKKYHDDEFVVENDVDTFVDELNVSRIDYGGGLSKQVNAVCPEVVPLQSIAFCDQTDILSGPIGLKHYFSPDKLLDMADKGWGQTSNRATITLEGLIGLSTEEKKNKNGQSAQTPGRYIEIYEVHGNLPKRFADINDTSGKYESRIFICAFYQKKDSTDKQGVILYTAPESVSPFKIVKRDPVFGRALGFGGAEELFEPQVWVNYDMIRTHNLLDAASKTIMITQDPTLVAKHPTGMKDMENMEFIEEAPNSNTRQLDTFPRNIRLFENSIINWENHAKDIGGAQDPLQGKEPTAGTPFSSLIEQVRQGMGLHEYRRGQFAKHIEILYTCEGGILESMVKKMMQGVSWLSTLSVEEMNYVVDKVTENAFAKYQNELVLNGQDLPDEQTLQTMKDKFKADFRKKGGKHLLEILKGELKDIKLVVKVSVAGKSKALGAMTERVVNIFRFVFSNPQGFAQVMQIPGMSKAFNQILEYSGLNPVDFAGIEKIQFPQPMQQPQTQPQPVNNQPALA